MTNFTKGKWLIKEVELQTSICSTQCEHFYIETDELHRFISIQNESRIESEANAHLIAAAPEMYAMLEMVLYVIDFLTDEVSTDDIKDLLSKARGE